MGIELTNEQIYATYAGENWFHSQTKQVFEVAGPAGSGKAQPVNTLIPTPDGTKLLGNLKVGDYVFNRHGKPVEILGIYDQGMKDAYKVTLKDGRSTICNDEHLWTYKTDTGELKTTTLKKMMEMMKTTNLPYSVPQSSMVEYPKKEFKISPYDVGKSIGLFYESQEDKEYLRYSQMYPIIPEEYFYGDNEQRLELIQGIYSTKGLELDSDEEAIYYSFNKNFVCDIQYILRSLGYITTMHFISDRYYLQIINKEINEERYIDIISVEYLNYQVDMKCIYVDDPEHLYLTNDFIVTHNTSLILYLIEKLELRLDQVLFVAFMGKAACRMALDGLPAKTIHSAIYKYDKVIARDENGKIIYNDYGKPKKVGRFVLRDRIGKGIKLIVLDEASMVNEEIGKDLLSFDIPVIVLGDLNQLPPVFGKPYFLREPDVVLTKIMRQNEGNPIVYLSQQVLSGKELNVGIYGTSEIIHKSEIKEHHFTKADIVLTETNRLRWNINNFFREEIRQYKQLDYPHIGEKVICRKNNWTRSVDNGIYLTNGTSGYVDDIFKDTYDKKTMMMDFRPDFTSSVFKNIKFNYPYMYAVPSSALDENIEENKNFDIYNDRFEYGYAITTHLSQGSQYNKVLYLHEGIMRTKEEKKQLAYVAITRAVDSVTIVI